jgi:hypothetical protein
MYSTESRPFTMPGFGRAGGSVSVAVSGFSRTVVAARGAARVHPSDVLTRGEGERNRGKHPSSVAASLSLEWTGGLPAEGRLSSAAHRSARSKGTLSVGWASRPGAPPPSSQSPCPARTLPGALAVVVAVVVSGFSRTVVAARDAARVHPSDVLTRGEGERNRGKHPSSAGHVGLEQLLPVLNLRQHPLHNAAADRAVDRSHEGRQVVTVNGRIMSLSSCSRMWQW